MASHMLAYTVTFAVRCKLSAIVASGTATLTLYLILLLFLLIGDGSFMFGSKSPMVTRKYVDVGTNFQRQNLKHGTLTTMYL